MIPLTVDNRDDLLKYLIPIGFKLADYDDGKAVTQIYVHKGKNIVVEVSEELNLVSVDYRDEEEYRTYSYPLVIPILNDIFKCEFRKEKLKKLLT